jgi:ribosomal protein S12 methylthiotransferase
MRGKHASKPIESILDEAQQLAGDGVRELIVVAQDTTYYGMDLYGRPRLAELLCELDKIDVDWIRLMYFYPKHVDDRLIDVVARSSRIVPYIDLPLQHINDRMLRRMSRRVTREETISLLRRLRERITGLTLRTTLIVGFPGETEEEFEELVEFVKQQRFERLGVFTYSLENTTPSASMDGHVTQEVKERRRAQLMELQQQIVCQQNRALIGQRRPVLIDCPVPEEHSVWIGRTFADAPDVDGLVFVTEEERGSLRAGAMTDCEIVASKQYDLVGVAVGEPW